MARNKLLDNPALAAPPAPRPGMPSMDDLTDALKKTTFLASALKGLLIQKTVSRKQIFDLSSTLMNEGLITAPQAAKELASLPEQEGTEPLKVWLYQHWANAEVQTEQLAEVIGRMGAAQRQAATSPAMPPEPNAGQPQGAPPNAILQ